MGWDRPKKRKKKISHSEPFSPDLSLRFPKKIKIKLKKFIKKIKIKKILASFQAETGREWLKKREKKFLAWNHFYPTQAREFPKK